VILRPEAPEDASACGVVCVEAYKAFASDHNFPWAFPLPEVATGLMKTRLAHPGLGWVVAESEGKVLDSNFLDERSPIAGLGPITVDPAPQNQAIGCRLVRAAIGRTCRRLFPSVTY